jgi:hypothetical protein
MRFRSCPVCGQLVAPGRFIHTRCEAEVFKNATINGVRDNDAQLDAAAIAFGNTAAQARALYHLFCKHEDLTFSELQDLTGMEYSPLGPRIRFLRGYRNPKKGQPVINHGYTGPVLVRETARRRHSTRTAAKRTVVYEVANR